MSRFFLNPQMLQIQDVLIHFRVPLWLGWVFVWILYFLGGFKCTCTLVTYFEKYFCTSLDINTGHDWNKPLSMAYIHMDGTGMNAAACRYCISYGRNDVWYMLLICYFCGSVGDALGWSVSRIFHNTLLLYLGPWMTILLLYLIVTSCALNTDMNPESQIFPIQENWTVCEAG